MSILHALNVGTRLNRLELEAALTHLDRNSDGKVELSEFTKWWVAKDSIVDFV